MPQKQQHLKRAESLYYPPDATSAKSDYRITQVTYVIVTNTNIKYEFNGDLKSLPDPVMAPYGYSVVDDLKKEGISVLETSGDIKSFRILSLRQGCIVTLPEIAFLMMKKPEYKDKFYI